MDRLTEADVAPFRDSSASGGDALRRAREVRNLTIVDVARQIHLSTSQVRDLESGRAESFHNAEVRRRLGGRYCDFLDLPRSLVADSPRADSPLQLPGSPVRARPVGTRHGATPWWLFGVFLLLGAMVVQAAWQWWGAQAWDRSFPTPMAAPPLSITPLTTPPLTVPPTAPPTVALVPAPAPVPPAPVPSPAVSQGRLKLTAHGDRCWVEVQHDQGRIARVLQPGEIIELPEKGLHRVFVGNVRAMTATLNGEALDLRSTGGVTARYDAP